jgi:FkbM family methyltransferase
MKIKTLILRIFPIAICFIVLYYLHFYRKNADLIEISNFNRISIIDLKSPLNDQEIKCRKSAKIADIETTICIHDVNKDVWVSGSIWNSGVWEGDIVQKWVTYVKKYKDCLVLDIGANIGQYTMFAAKIGRDVVSVEPFEDNILRIHKASQLENLQGKIKIVKNAISNKRNQLKMLSSPKDQPNNIGAQRIKIDENDLSLIVSKDEQKYLVETILFDDLTNIMPSNYKCAVIKMDIEGFEPYAFQYSNEFFNKYSVEFIIMEWGVFTKYVRVNESIVQNMINIFTSHNLHPFRVKHLRKHIIVIDLILFYYYYF